MNNNWHVIVDGKGHTLHYFIQSLTEAEARAEAGDKFERLIGPADGSSALEIKSGDLLHAEHVGTKTAGGGE